MLVFTNGYLEIMPVKMHVLQIKNSPKIQFPSLIYYVLRPVQANLRSDVTLKCVTLHFRLHLTVTNMVNDSRD